MKICKYCMMAMESKGEDDKFVMGYSDGDIECEWCEDIIENGEEYYEI